MNRNLLPGCGGALAVLILLGGMVILETSDITAGRRRIASRTIAEDERIRALEAAWEPPSATLDPSWFPAEVEGWRRERAEGVRAIPELGIERTGPHAVYRSSLGTIRVHLIPATELERAEFVARAQDTLVKRESPADPDAGGTKRAPRRETTTQGNRTHLRIGVAGHTRFWWLKGWLFIFRARGAADSERFPEEFLKAMARPAPAPAKSEQN